MVYFGPEIRTGYDYRDALALAGKGNKPEGVAVELADAAIRIGDCAGAYGLSLEGIPGCGDTVASLRHSDLVSHESFGAWMCEACLPLCELGVVPHEEHGNPRADMLAQSLCAIRGMAHWLGITGNELERAIEIKHAYNRTRSHRHGNKLL